MAKLRLSVDVPSPSTSELLHQQISRLPSPDTQLQKPKVFLIQTQKQTLLVRVRKAAARNSGMDHLPQELVDRVCSFLPKEDLRSVLTLTTKLRHSAERYSYVFDHCTVSNGDLELFLTIYSGHRLPYLRELAFRPSLDLVSIVNNDTSSHCRYTEEELRSKDRAFTSQVEALFRTLKTVETGAGDGRRHGRYKLSIYSPMEEVEQDRYYRCLHHHFPSWRLHLLNPSALPDLTSVHSLTLLNHSPEEVLSPLYLNDAIEAKLDLRIILDLAQKLPNLEYMGIETGGHEWHSVHHQFDPAQWYERDWEGPRRDARHGFANAVGCGSFSLPRSLTRATLDFLNPLDKVARITQDQLLPDLVSPAMKDPFSSSLCTLSQNLRQLKLRGVLDESLFWPSGDAGSFGACLEILEIMFHIARPDGKWYFQGPGGQGKDAVGFAITEDCYPPLEPVRADREMDEAHEECMRYDTRFDHRFRIEPDDRHLRPFLAGFATAARKMVFLQEALIWTPVNFEPLVSDDSDDSDEDLDRYDYSEWDQAWGIFYYAPGFPSWARKECRQLWWMVGHWRPDSQLQKDFRLIGSAQHEVEIVERWTEDFGDGPTVYRDQMFTNFMFSDGPRYSQSMVASDSQDSDEPDL